MANANRAYASVHAGYAAEGARGFYERHGNAYRNPHEPIIRDLISNAIRDWNLDLTNVLDLAAGSGEASLAITLCARTIHAIDPFTATAYTARTGRTCESLTFENIAAGAIADRRFSLIVCSFALHLAEPSRLPTLCWQLARIGGQLLILTPHKRPAIDPGWGWTLTHERMQERVRCRLYTVQPAAKGLS